MKHSKIYKNTITSLTVVLFTCTTDDMSSGSNICNGCNVFGLCKKSESTRDNNDEEHNNNAESEETKLEKEKTENLQRFLSTDDLLKNYSQDNKKNSEVVGEFTDNPKPLGIFNVYKLNDLLNCIGKEEIQLEEHGTNKGYKYVVSEHNNDKLYIVIDKANKYILPYICSGIVTIKASFLSRNNFWTFAYINNEIICTEHSKEVNIIANPNIKNNNDDKSLKTYAENKDFIKITCKNSVQALRLSDDIIREISKYAFP